MIDVKKDHAKFVALGNIIGEAGVKHKNDLQKRLRAIFSWNKIKR
jgi:hypothetical protein